MIFHINNLISGEKLAPSLNSEAVGADISLLSVKQTNKETVMTRLMTLLAVFITATLGGCTNVQYLDIETLILQYTWPWYDFTYSLAVAGIFLFLFGIYTLLFRNETKDWKFAIRLYLASITLVWICYAFGYSDAIKLISLLGIPFYLTIEAKDIGARRNEDTPGIIGLINRFRERRQQTPPAPPPNPQVTCPHCSTSNPQGFRFCKECGKPPLQAISPPSIQQASPASPPSIQQINPVQPTQPQPTRRKRNPRKY